MSFANRYSFDKKSAEEGKWISKGDGLDILVRRSNSKAVRDVIARVNKPYNHLTKRGGELPGDIADLVNRRVVAEGILLDWRDTPVAEGEEKIFGAPRPDGVEPAEGNAIPYTTEVGMEFMKLYPDFLEDVFETASVLENFRQQEVKEISGNS